MEWNFKKEGFFVGGKFPLPNLSKGMHDIMRQWWWHYAPPNPSVLLVSETNETKKVFEGVYPTWSFTTLNMDSDADIVHDILTPIAFKFDLIINQAMLEHCYDPFGAMKNMFNMLTTNGIIVSHTHVPGFPEHRYPRDYFRFMSDWWVDLKNHFNVVLLEHYQDKDHVFTCYRKL